MSKAEIAEMVIDMMKAALGELESLENTNQCYWEISLKYLEREYPVSNIVF